MLRQVLSKLPLSSCLKDLQLAPTLTSTRGYPIVVGLEHQAWKMPPLLEKDADGFYLDNRRGQREVLDIKFTPSTPVQGPIRFEVPDEEDFDLYTQFNSDQFAASCEFMHICDSSFEDLLPFFTLHSRRMIKDRVSFFVFDDDRLIGLSTNCVYDKAEWEHVFPYGYGHKNPKLEMLDDYADLIASYDLGSRPADLVGAFLDEAMSRSGPFFPADMKVLATADCTLVHQAYHKTGLGVCIIENAPQVMKHRKNADAVFGHCVAPNSSYICTHQGGYKALVNVPYDRFVERGKPVFKPTKSGKTGDLVVLKRV